MAEPDSAIADIAGTDLGTRVVSYTEQDAILHALAIGASPEDLSLVYERDLRTLPSMLFGFGLWAVEAAGRIGAYDPTQSLHASQELFVHRALPRSGEIEMQGRIRDVWDKGRAALIDIEVTSDHGVATYGIFVPGAGGWGGERGPSPAKPDHDRPPSASSSFETREDQAALYRLTGDLHPVHIDPEIARAGGFDRPILHGLCTLGIAVRESAALVGEHPADLASVAARFTAPVLPGETLVTSVWQGSDTTTFATNVADAPVLVGTDLRFRSAGNGLLGG